MVFATFGFLSPASRGSLLTAALILYLLMSIAAGYAAVWIWGAMNRSHDGWQKVCWRTACFFPGVTVTVMSLRSLALPGPGVFMLVLGGAGGDWSPGGPRKDYLWGGAKSRRVSLVATLSSLRQRAE